MKPVLCLLALMYGGSSAAEAGCVAQPVGEVVHPLSDPFPAPSTHLRIEGMMHVTGKLKCDRTAPLSFTLALSPAPSRPLPREA